MLKRITAKHFTRQTQREDVFDHESLKKETVFFLRFTQRKTVKQRISVSLVTTSSDLSLGSSRLKEPISAFAFSHLAKLFKRLIF